MHRGSRFYDTKPGSVVLLNWSTSLRFYLLVCLTNAEFLYYETSEPTRSGTIWSFAAFLQPDLTCDYLTRAPEGRIFFVLQEPRNLHSPVIPPQRAHYGFFRSNGKFPAKNVSTSIRGAVTPITGVVETMVCIRF